MKKIVIVLIFTGLLCLYNICFADIYKYADKEGILHLTNIYDSEPCKTYGCKRIMKEIPPHWGCISDNFYYDKTNVTKLYNIVSVWTYSFLTDDERNKKEEESKKRDSDKSLKCLLYNHESVLYEINCNNRMKKMKKITYSNWNSNWKENVLDEYTKENSEWESITPESVFNKLYNKVCVTPNQPNIDENKYDDLITKAANKFKLDSALIKAIIKAGSNFNPKAVSPVGAQGLMQLKPAMASALKIKDSFNPEQNIEGGARYLRYLLNTYKGDLTLALAAYNAGEKAVAKYNYNIPPYRKTQNYVRRVLSFYKSYTLQ
jgi:hypothetical protein